MEIRSNLTIVTVVKNDELGLNRTCESLCRQSRHANYLIIDGASTDGTQALGLSWAEKLNGRFISEVDQGPYSAMNKALGLLEREDYVWFVNAGDLLPSDTTTEYVLERINKEPPVWGFGSCIIAERDGTIRKQTKVIRPSVERIAYGQTPICHQTVVAKVGAIRELGGFDVNYRIAADFKLNLLMAQRFEPEIWDRPIAIYSAGGISDTNLQRTRSEQILVRREVLQRDRRDFLRRWKHAVFLAPRIMVGSGLDRLANKGLISVSWRAHLVALRRRSPG
jgi:hypothetical protein